MKGFHITLTDPGTWASHRLHVTESAPGQLLGTVRDTLLVGRHQYVVVLNVQLGGLIEPAPDLIYAHLGPWLQSLGAAVAAELAAGDAPPPQLSTT